MQLNSTLQKQGSSIKVIDLGTRIDNALEG
jgi:hypothetical protein